MNRSAIHELRLIAKQRGGKSFSREYVNAKSPLRWSCALGHQWRASLASVVRRRTWCPACAGNRKLELKDLYRIARERGGRCLSRRYLNVRSLLTWECRYGHRWRAAAGQVKGGSHQKGTWCPKCYDQRRSFRPLGTIEEMRTLALSRGGTCLSNNYSGSRERLWWQCEQGHQWYALPGGSTRRIWVVGWVNAVVGVRSAQEIKNYDWEITAPYPPNMAGNACRQTTETMMQSLDGGAQMVMNGLHRIQRQTGKLVRKMRAQSKEGCIETQTRTSLALVLSSSFKERMMPEHCSVEKGSPAQLKNFHRNRFQDICVVLVAARFSLNTGWFHCAMARDYEMSDQALKTYPVRPRLDLPTILALSS